MRNYAHPDLLPDIKIKPDVKSRQFIERIESLAIQRGGFEIQKVYDLDNVKGWDILNLAPLSHKMHKGLYGQLIYHPDKSLHIMVEMRATQWNPDPPTYEVYIRSVFEVFKPLIQIYNKSYKTRLRLAVRSKSSLELRLPPTAKNAFDRFVTLANKSCLHPLDWKRFYGFVRVCHARRVHLYEDDLIRLLLKAGFDKGKASYIADIFHHCTDLLKFK